MITTKQTVRSLLRESTFLWKFLQMRHSCKSSRDKCIEQTVLVKTGSNLKVTIVGTGAVGSAIAFSLLNQRITNELCLIDDNTDKAKIEMWDLQQGSAYLDNAKILSSNNLMATMCSRICILATDRPATVDADEMKKVVDKLKAVIPKLIEYSPDATIVVMENPVELCTYAAWRISGLPINRVLGSGTLPDTIRFRYFISERMGVAPAAVQAMVIGQHGPNSIPLWSSVSVGGVRLMDLNPELGTEGDEEKWDEVHKKVVNTENAITQGKGLSNWTTALMAADITRAILNDNNIIYPLATSAKCLYGIDTDLFLSLPSILTSEGIIGIIKPKLNEEEITQICKIKDGIAKAQENLALEE